MYRYHIIAFLIILCIPHSLAAPACGSLHLHKISDLISILHTHVYMAITYLHSLSFHAILIPFPPPPAEALTITGYPISLAYFTHVSASSTTPSWPGIMLTPAFMAIRLLSILSPMAWIDSLEGPMNSTPISACKIKMFENTQYCKYLVSYRFS